MKTKFLLFVVVFVCSFLTRIQAQVNVSDSLALVDLYNATGGPGWTNHNNWLTSKRLSTWYGVYESNHKVYNISLNYNNLTGTLPETLGNLDALETLNLDYNHLTGGIPDSLVKLKKLGYLALSRNDLKGAIPASLGDLTTLTSLTLRDNKLTGKIPSSLGNCTQLQSLSLSNNKLTGGIPKSFKNLVNLEGLGVSYNNLSGSLEDVFPEQSLEFDLDLSHNRFTGSIPAFMGGFTKLISLYLDHNYFTGQIPEELGNLREIEDLDLAGNQLTGGIPKSFDSLPYLFSLDLHDNLLYENYNPTYSGKKFLNTNIAVFKNRFTFNGLEYLVKKYLSVILNPQDDILIHTYQNKLSVSAGGTLSNNTYKWFRAGQSKAITILGDSTFLPTKSGVYYAKITNSIVTGLTLKTDTITYTMPLANKELTIAISPNPAKDIISIHGLNYNSNAKITIANMSGYVWMIAISRQQSAMEVNVSRLKAGNYVVSVSDGKEVKTLQFVKE